MKGPMPLGTRVWSLSKLFLLAGLDFRIVSAGIADAAVEPLFDVVVGSREVREHAVHVEADAQ